MKPTPQLRYVERVVPISENTGTRVRVLQQWWATDPDSEMDFMLKVNGEWLDVPLEKEA
jgi:hypothetical protein